MKITFLSPVRHDGKDYNEGDSANVKDASAIALIEAGAARLSGSGSSKPSSKDAPESNTGSNDGNSNDNDNDE